MNSTFLTYLISQNSLPKRHLAVRLALAIQLYRITVASGFKSEEDHLRIGAQRGTHTRVKDYAAFKIASCRNILHIFSSNKRKYLPNHYL